MDNTWTIAQIKAKIARNKAVLNGPRVLSSWEREFRESALARDTRDLATEMSEANTW